MPFLHVVLTRMEIKCCGVIFFGEYNFKQILPVHLSTVWVAKITSYRKGFDVDNFLTKIKRLRRDFIAVYSCAVMFCFSFSTCSALNLF